MGLPVFIPAAVALANAALAALVFQRSPKAEVNRLFALTALAAAGWAGTNALFQGTHSAEVAMLAAQASSVSSLLMSASFLHFSWLFPLRATIRQGQVFLLWTLTLLLGVLSLWPDAVDRAVELEGTRRILTGPGFYMVALFLTGTAFAAFFRFWRSTLTLHGTLREQALWVLAGTGLTAVCGIVFNLLFPLFGDYRFVWLGPSCSLFFVGATVYSIIAHRLFDIRLIVKKTVLYSLLLAGISALYSGVEYLLTEVLKSLSPEGASPVFTQIAGALVVSLCFHPARLWLERKIHRLLYPKRKARLHGKTAAPVD